MIHFRLGFMSAGRGWGEAADRQKGKEEAANQQREMLMSYLTFPTDRIYNENN